MGAALQADGETGSPFSGPQASEGEAQHGPFCVSVKDTSVCIVDDAGRIGREVKVASEPEALLTVLRNPAYRFKRIGLKLDRCRNGCSVRLLKQVCR